ncbi:MAG: discoidin domain-containing protein [Phycisphaerae bacterium]|nr:discoidin domain-containing protein [Phycisphaerae bacterium]
MYCKPIVSFVVVILVCLVSSPAQAQEGVNLLPNGGLEAGDTTGWGIPGNVEKAEVVTQLVGAAVPQGPVEGDYCLYVENSDTSGESQVWDVQLKALNLNQITLKAGKIYTISAFLKSKSGPLAVRMLLEHNAGGAWPILAGGNNIDVTEEWTEFYRTTGTPLQTDLTALQYSFHFGNRQGAFWIDDVRLYEGEYIETIYNPTGQATKPRPANASVDVPRDTILSWEPGQPAVSYTVYFGEKFDDVNDRNPGTLAAEGLDVNELALETRPEFGVTYFWAVDEVNGPPDHTVIKGDVWRFTAEPYAVLVPGSAMDVTASSASAAFSAPEKTIDGSGLEGDTHSTRQEDMWLSAAGDLTPWLMVEFDQTQKLDRMLIWNSNSLSEAFIGWGLKDVNIEYSMDAVDWTGPAESIQINRAPGLPTYDSPQVIDLGLIAAKYVRLNILSNWGALLKQYSVSEVQFYALPVQAREPKPASGSVDVLPNATVTWRAGREAGQHTIYASTDVNALAEGSAPSVTSMASRVDLGLLDLQLDETYYWRVDEVNEAQVPSVWAGPVWSLRTPVALIVDDFERYGNTSPNRPFQTWLDGFGYSADEFFPVEYTGNGTGAGIGHDIWSPGSPYFEGQIMETETTLPGSSQSLPFYYSSPGGAASQTDRKWAVPQDWTLGGAQILVLHFFGDPGNTGQLYLKVNSGSQVVYDGSTSAISTPEWTQWNIDLASLGVNLQSVTQLSIGAQGGSGMVYIDDIQLYREAPADPGE